jgi:peptidoglycan/LPS O-acetylase OafA/YrhL
MTAATLRTRTNIQVLRAVAVLAVMVFHFDASLLPGGFVGVDEYAQQSINIFGEMTKID